MVAITAVFFVTLILHHSMSSSSFKRSCLDHDRPSTYLSGLCFVLHEGNAKDRADASSQCNTDHNGHLATIYNQAQIQKMAALVDLSMPMWCDLKRDPNDTNSWLHTSNDDGPKPKASNLPWNPNVANNPSLVGDGVLVGENGIKNQDETTIHPFLCQYAEPVNDPTEYNKRNSGYRASDDDALNWWWADRGSGAACGSSRRELRLRPGFDLSKIPKGGPRSHTLLVYRRGRNCEHRISYYPLDPSQNGIVATLSGDLNTCMAEWFDGKLMVFGGWGTVSAWLIDPETYMTVGAADMPIAHISNAASTTLHGAIVVCGGLDSSATPVLTDVCIKFKNYQWVSMPPLNVKRDFIALTNLNNKLYAVGGYDAAGNDVLEQFNPETDSWTVMGQMPIGGSLSGVAIFEGAIFTCGGYTRKNKCQKYNEASDQWISVGSTNADRFDTHLLVFNHNLYVVGGWADSFGGTPEKRLEIYNTTSDSWSFAQTERAEDRKLFAALVV